MRSTIAAIAPLAFLIASNSAQARVCSDPSSLRMAVAALQKMPAHVIYTGDHRFPEVKASPVQTADSVELVQDPCYSDRKDLRINGKEVRLEHVFIRVNQTYFRNLAFYSNCSDELLGAEPLGLEIRDPDSGKVKITSEQPLF